MPEQDAHETPMMFRVWGRQHELFALMPTILGTYDPATCSAYAQVGQHGSADPCGCIQRSRPATPEEYGPLKRELEGLGYRVKVIRRTSRKHYEARKAELAAIKRSA